MGKDHDNNFENSQKNQGCFQQHCWNGWRKFVFSALWVAVLIAIVIPISQNGEDPQTTLYSLQKHCYDDAKQQKS